MTLADPTTPPDDLIKDGSDAASWPMSSRRRRPSR